MSIERGALFIVICVAMASLIATAEDYKAQIKDIRTHIEDARGFIGCVDGRPVIRNVYFGNTSILPWLALALEQCSEANIVPYIP